MGFDYNALWQMVLDELALQMTVATFDRWLRGTRARGNDDVLVVTVANENARAWVEGRLSETIVRTVERMAGRLLEVRFVNAAEDPKEQTQEKTTRPGFVLPAFDVHEPGWFPISEYECRFWAPLLGRVAWRVWEIVRRADRRKRKTEWTPARRWTAPALGEMVPCGKQALVGVERRVAEGTPGAREDEAGVWRVLQRVRSVRGY